MKKLFYIFIFLSLFGKSHTPLINDVSLHYMAGVNIAITNNYGISTDGNMLLGSAGLTGGNTGTVAVLSDAVFTIEHSVIGGTNPADATTYYWSFPVNTQTQGAFKFYLPYNCTLIGYSGNIYSNTIGTAESATINIIHNGVTTNTTNITNTANFSNTIQTFSVNNLSVNIAAGSYGEIQILCPTWVTNPLTVTSVFKVFYVRRQ